MINIVFTCSLKVKSVFYRFFAPSLSTNINSFCATLLPQYHRSLTSFSHCCCYFVAPRSLWQLLCFLWQTATVMATSYQQHSYTAIATTTTIFSNYKWSRSTFTSTIFSSFLPLMLLHHLIDLVCGLGKLSPQQCYVFLFPSSLFVLFRLLSQVLRIFPFTLFAKTNK